MAKLSNNVGKDSVRLNEYAKRIERLCRYSDVFILHIMKESGHVFTKQKEKNKDITSRTPETAECIRLIIRNQKGLLQENYLNN